MLTLAMTKLKRMNGCGDEEGEDEDHVDPDDHTDSDVADD